MGLFLLRLRRIFHILLRVLLGKWVVGMGAIGKWGKMVERRWHAMMTRTTARTDTWWHRWWPAEMAKACPRVWQTIWECVTPKKSFDLKC